MGIVHVHVFINMHIPIYTYIYAYIHIGTHTHTHTCPLNLSHLLSPECQRPHLFTFCKLTFLALTLKFGLTPCMQGKGANVWPLHHIWVNASNCKLLYTSVSLLGIIIPYHGRELTKGKLSVFPKLIYYCNDSVRRLHFGPYTSEGPRSDWRNFMLSLLSFCFVSQTFVSPISPKITGDPGRTYLAVAILINTKDWAPQKFIAGFNVRCQLRLRKVCSRLF